MSKVFSEKLWVAIDIGTTKICVLIAHHLGDNQIEIRGIGKSPSYGLKKGVVVDIAKTVQSIKTAVKEAELMAGTTIESAVIGIAGSHIRSINSTGAVPIKRHEVQQGDITNVLHAAQAVQIAEGQQILHIMPQYFSIDGGDKLMDPLGMHGIRLEARVHIITGSIASVQDLIKCCRMAGVKVGDIILEQLASADAVLSDDERELGVGILDIGGGTSDFAIYQNGAIRHTMVLPVAGNHFTNDIAVGINTTIKEAERIKHLYGLALHSMLDDSEISIENIHGDSKKVVHASELVRIIEPRARELLNFINQEIMMYELRPLMRSGLVLTGGGSLLEGLPAIAQSIFRVPIRVGRPKTEYMLPSSLNNPMYATSYGLLVHAIKKQTKTFDYKGGPMSKKIFGRMKSWLADFF
ncbi:MAG: cell division protein FtsA [Candidatus Babeliales bacterium]